MPSLNPLEVVRGADRLAAIYDGWPHFHDAEITGLRLERAGVEEYDGPDLWVRFHLFRGRHDPRTPSGFAWYDHNLVTFRFGRVHGLELEGFNRQNAIYELEMEHAGPHPEAPGVEAIRVRLVKSFGLAGTFLCGEIEVTDIEPGKPPFTVYSDG